MLPSRKFSALIFGFLITCMTLAAPMAIAGQENAESSTAQTQGSWGQYLETWLVTFDQMIEGLWPAEEREGKDLPRDPEDPPENPEDDFGATIDPAG